MKSLIEIIESKKEVFQYFSIKEIEKFNDTLLKEVIKYQDKILREREERRRSIENMIKYVVCADYCSLADEYEKHADFFDSCGGYPFSHCLREVNGMTLSDDFAIFHWLENCYKQI